MRIEELIVYTNNLNAQIEFYSNLLEIEITQRTLKNCSFKIGQSLLTFELSEFNTPYHFAFNMPSNKEEEAMIWLKERVDLLTFHGKEMVDFRSWNAKALYFYDPDKNIVEFIARKNLKLNSNHLFSSKSILNISEIGIATTNIESTFIYLNTLQPILVYGGSFDRFCALGDEDGMFIMVNPLKKKWFPKDDPIHQSDFIIKGDFNFEFKNGKFIELV